MVTFEQVIYNAIDESLANIHTATIAKVTKVDAKTINCKPVFKRVVNGQEIDLPEFAEVPVFVLQGGTSSIRFPVAVGDYALLLFTERCFDGWWNGQDYQRPLEYRMHDYSDGIALVGLNNMAGTKDIPTVTTIDGDTVCNGDWIINGNLTVNDGTITVNNGDVLADGISLKTHTHGGVVPGSGSTGLPQ